ncbi:MAG: hypothetical protein ACP5SI_12595 [Chloroflexia bacterium]
MEEKRHLQRRARGQVLVLLALLIPAILGLFLFALSLAALHDARAHALYALNVATRAAARQVEYASYGEPDLAFARSAVSDTVRTVFLRGLALRPSGLADTPEAIAARTEVALGYGSPDRPWHSPFAPDRPHVHPTVSARAHISVRVWWFDLTLTVLSETEVK